MNDLRQIELAERDRALGLVQVAILHVIDRNPERAYGSAITDEVSRGVGRELADGQVYVALRRLEEHGLIRSHVEFSLPSKRSRGRPRKYYALTATGRRAMENAGAYTFSNSPFMQSTSRGDDEGTSQEGPMPAPVVV
jgi:DNA-binding PadR family transcriptional regulator